MAILVPDSTRILFFTGKGGVGKTSSACATAIGLAEAGKRVLLVSTDPASNLDEVLGLHLASAPRQVPGVPGLSALNIDPEQAARDYRERMVGPVRGLLPAAVVASMEEQLSGACTMEIAAFDEFSKLLGDPAITADFDHVLIDTAPTGHTLLLLDAAEAYHREVLRKASDTPEAVRQLLPRLRDPAFTRIVLVTLPEATPIHEAMPLERDLARADIKPYAWVVNQSLTPLDVKDSVLKSRQGGEVIHLRELLRHASRIVLEPWAESVAIPKSPVALRS